MSFKIEPGQLCVIVGENGSKSGRSASLRRVVKLIVCLQVAVSYPPIGIASNELLGADPRIHPESSTTKLLLRLFDPNEGQVLIDDRPIQDYRSDDLRQATSILWQDYQTFPLSVSSLLLR